MNLTGALNRFFFHDSAALRAQRSRILGHMSVAYVLLLTPFLLFHVVQRNVLMAAINLLMIAAFAGAARALARGRSVPLSFDWLLLLPALVGIGVLMETVGVQGALWSYPAMVFCQFALGRRMGFAAAVLLVLGTGLYAAHLSEPSLGWRVAATLLLLWLMIASALQVLAQAHDELLSQASTDPLTGALNRRQLDLALGELVNRARRRPVPASIVLIDIDNFKQINDRLGHAAGDQVLIAMVKLLNQRKRAADTLYRIGGEEFLLLAPDTAGIDASTFAEQLRRRVESTEMIDGVGVQISVGVSECRTDQAPEEWLELADQALYRAKEGGRNRVENSSFSDSAFKLAR